MADYLLDSDVLIWCLRGRADTLAYVRSISNDALPASSPLSLLEVELGMKKGEEEKTQEFLDSLKIISVTKKIARKAADYIRLYQSKGRQIDFVDGVIAATASLEGLTLVTYNLKHYPMPEISILSPPVIPR